SAGSKKAPEVKAGSVTVSGCGFSVRDAGSKASLLRSRPAIAPPIPEFRPCNSTAQANGLGSLLVSEEGDCRYICCQKPGNPDGPADAIPGKRQNPVDVHGRIFWTPPVPERSRATSSANFSRSAVRNGARPSTHPPGDTKKIAPPPPPVPAPLHELQVPPEPGMERVNHAHPLWAGLIYRFMRSRRLDRTPPARA